jgi:hypothetical protein
VPKTLKIGNSASLLPQSPKKFKIKQDFPYLTSSTNRALTKIDHNLKRSNSASMIKRDEIKPVVDVYQTKIDQIP